MSKASKRRLRNSKNSCADDGQAGPDTAMRVTLKTFLQTVSGPSTRGEHAPGSCPKRPEQPYSNGVRSGVAHDGSCLPLGQPVADNSLMAREVLDASLQCNLKLHLRLRGKRDVKSDYEMLCDDSRKKVVKDATAKIVTSHSDSDYPAGVRLTSALLKRGDPFILNGTILTEFGELNLEGVKKVSGFSRLGDFHYIPIVCYEGQKIPKEQRLLLEVCALFISRIQGTIPGKGAIYHGSECKLTTVRLSPDLKQGRHILEEIRRSSNSEHAPKLVLNNHCKICEFMKRCYRQAIEEDNLSLLGGIGEKDVKKYARRGIFTLSQLAHTFRPRRKGKRAEQTRNRYHALQAMALRDKMVYVLGTPNLPDSPVRIYLDAEGDPDEGYIYLIGMIVSDGTSESSYSFWAHNRDQELDIFGQLLSTLRQFQEFRLFCYGGYEKAFVKRMRKKIEAKKEVDRILEKTTNTLSLIYAHIYFPVFTNGLKEIGSYLGSQWTDEQASGTQSIVWRRRWEYSGDGEWKERLVTYNLEDCAALQRVTEFLYAVVNKTSSIPRTSITETGEDASSRIAQVEDLDDLAYPSKWGPVNFVHPDYKYVNRCAYFDYQRERVYVRTCKILKKTAAKEGKGTHKNSKLRVSKRLCIENTRCPICGSKSIPLPSNEWPQSLRMPRTKRAFDLVFTPSGIKRKVIECSSAGHTCQTCGEMFVPPQYDRLDKHYHSLKSWAMFQHVAYGTSFRVLEEMFREFLRAPYT